MKEKKFQENVRISFKQARMHVNRLEEQINTLKEAILLQNKVLKELTTKVSSFVFPNNIPKTSFFEEKNKKNDLHSLSKHLSTQNSIEKKNEELKLIDEEFNSSIGNDRAKHIPPFKEKEKNSNISPNNAKFPYHPLLLTKEKKFFDDHFEIFKHKINETFQRLTKQELRVFMVIYQFAEENKTVSYLDLAGKLSLSENCVRSYVSVLIRKGLPIIKKKINNKITYLSIEKDFQNLNLRHKLINLYYGVDPFQTSLFDIPH